MAGKMSGAMERAVKHYERAAFSSSRGKKPVYRIAQQFGVSPSALYRALVRGGKINHGRA